MSTDTQPDSTPDVGFEDVDWEQYEGGLELTPIRIATVLSVAVVIAGWVLDSLFGSHRQPIVDAQFGPIEFAPNPGNVEWLFILTVVVLFFYGVVPLYRNPRRTKHYWTELKKNKAAVASLFFLAFVFALAVVGPFVFGRPELDVANAYEPPVFYQYVPGLEGGTWAHPLGTMQSGEDLLQIVVIGARVSMMVGLIGCLIIIVLASAVGTTAAYFGGWVDEVLMRFVDIMLTFPTFFLILFVVYLYGGDLFTIILILGFTTWTATSRLVRSEALQRNEEQYIEAAKNVGASERWIITRHLVPNVSNTIITAATLVIPSLILYEAVLAFLGFGDPNVWSWGRAISEGRSDIQNAWWVATIPGVFLFLTVLAFNFLGDALRDALDPRHQ
ncbi:ABC transporter permease [Natrarchaeobaculum sulfurireducens]|uniref:ABC-type dipeptide/oligopeptide/nickel transportsystem, permease component n=1 Tax=Natrarchaeobaculum sulfurireducens TaxID=2044521 RepID=A0A346PMM2_9EURY|nr:ABC transporter permease [Natrarchaeobaculum sulfurireducens]AXR79187.1 ABC-type dipeptide/oligopeptide/nickel transportsystem, permease component [Natrarchaeobaculum sulfurireducens]AXR80767.1 Oligopeptide transport system permease protein OppC [Natrarchaeobaculum sulfurireducens]